MKIDNYPQVVDENATPNLMILSWWSQDLNQLPFSLLIPQETFYEGCPEWR